MLAVSITVTTKLSRSVRFPIKCNSITPTRYRITKVCFGEGGTSMPKFQTVILSYLLLDHTETIHELEANQPVKTTKAMCGETHKVHLHV